jgi:hypothetical protein
MTSHIIYAGCIAQNTAADQAMKIPEVGRFSALDHFCPYDRCINYAGIGIDTASCTCPIRYVASIVYRIRTKQTIECTSVLKAAIDNKIICSGYYPSILVVATDAKHLGFAENGKQQKNRSKFELHLSKIGKKELLPSKAVF